MAVLPSNNLQESWAPEAELREPPPRRFVSASSEYPDLNQPSKILFLGFGGAVFLGGMILLLLGLTRSGVVPILLGIVLAVGGAIVASMYQTKLRSHLSRAEHLVTFGVPVVARILHADNMTGDSIFARSIKYQIILPGGDIVHRSVNVDERLLPRVVPGDATALMDMNSGEAELYAALPLRAILKGAPVSQVPTARVSPTLQNSVPNPAAAVSVDVPMAPAAVGSSPGNGENAGQMGTLGGGAAPVRPVAPAPVVEPDPAPVVPPPAEPEKEKEPGTDPAGSSGLPWE